MTRLKEIVIYTDGACRGNPGPGGWGAILHCNQHRRELKGSDSQTTNNRMELTAAIEALSVLDGRSKVELHTDSEYLRKGITEWIGAWKKRGWKTAGKKPVKNMDLWLALDEVSNSHEVNWKWVKGHSGDPGNERADQLANEAIDDFLAGS